MTFVERLTRDRHLPLVVLDDPATAGTVAAEVAAAGLGLLEVTLRSAAALPGIAAIAERDDVWVGAGTVTSPALVDAVVAVGARFVVTPGFHAPVVERCVELGVPVLPGVATPGEVMAAQALGLDVLKLFPVAALGGPAYVDALAAPFPSVRFVPSGGVRRADRAAYLARPTVVAVSGTWGAL